MDTADILLLEARLATMERAVESQRQAMTHLAEAVEELTNLVKWISGVQGEVR